MLAVKSMDVRDNFKDWCNKVINGETLIVSRPRNENVVIVSEKEYHKMIKAKHNAEYTAELDKSQSQLRAMEADDWTPTQKVIDFMEKMSNE